ncbi:Fic family protein [Ruminobacter sp.]|uniref:Fic family protein n=1 Tax=unclassified Ruminobacter TaxID=2627913 RepID=UPI00338F7AD1
MKEGNPVFPSVLKGKHFRYKKPSQLSQHAGGSHRPAFRENYLNQVLSQVIIEMTVPDKPESRNQKYKLKQ